MLIKRTWKLATRDTPRHERQPTKSEILFSTETLLSWLVNACTNLNLTNIVARAATGIHNVGGVRQRERAEFL